MTAAVPAIEKRSSRLANTLSSAARNNGWVLGLIVFLLLMLLFTKFVQPRYGSVAIQNLGTSVMPLAFAAVAQAVVVLAAGIDLSIPSMMALTSVFAATQMQNNPGDGMALAVVVLTLILGALLGAINGGLVVTTKVPDIVVTLATFFVWAGFALLVRSSPGGAAAKWLKDLVVGSLGNEWVPKAVVVMLVIVGVIWIPLSRSRRGLSIYAIGSNQLAAFRSGVSVGRTKVFAYIVAGVISAVAGLTLTASTGIGTPVPDGSYALLSIGAVVLGGVSLAGGRGGVLGPIVAVFILQLIRDDMTFMGINPNYALVAQGMILIAVVAVGSLIQTSRSRT